MYTIVTAYGVRHDQGARWSNLTLADTPVYEIFTLYRKVYLTLSTIYLEDPVYVDMDDMRVDHSAFTGTLQELLDSLGNNAPPTVESVPVYDPKFATYTDAFRAGYKIELMSNTGSFTSNTTADTKVRVRIDRPIPTTDMGQFQKSCLVSINGFYHMTDTDGKYTYVIDAGKSLQKSRQNQVGILSFANIGDIELVPITDEMIYSQGEGSFLSERAYVNLNKNVEGKTVLLVLGGYLNFQSAGSFFQTGDSTFCIDFNRIPTLSRFYESSPYINYDELGLTSTSANKTQIDLAQFFSDEVLIKYLKMPQSFFVIVDTPSLFTNRIHLRHSNLPGMFTAYKDPKYPLIVGHGRTAEYWKTFEDQQWSVTVYDSILHRRVFDYLDKKTTPTVSDSRTPEKTYFNSRGYLLEIGKDH